MSAYNENNTSTDTPLPSLLFHETPKKIILKQNTPVPKPDRVDTDICQICKIRDEFPGGIETNTQLVNCSHKKGCN